MVNVLVRSLAGAAALVMTGGVGTAMAAPQGWQPLLEPAALNGMLEQNTDVRVVRLTGEYDAGHIPGAVSIPYGQFRGPGANPGQLPELDQLTGLLQEAGIAADTPVVLVHAGQSAPDMGAATRVYWTLKSLGVQDLAVLNGGFQAWQSAGLPVSTEVVDVPDSDYRPQWNDRWQATTAELEELVAQGEGGATRIVDARPPAFFQGEQASADRAGTLPRAENLPFTGWFDGNRMKPAGELSAMAGSSPGQAGAVTFCNTGHLGSINWFVMSELAGVENTRLYAESVTEWAQSDRRPMDNEPAGTTP